MQEDNNLGYAIVLINKDGSYLFVDVDEVLFSDSDNILEILNPQKDKTFVYEKHFYPTKEAIKDDLQMLTESYPGHSFGFVVIKATKDPETGSIIHNVIEKPYDIENINDQLFDARNKDYEIPDEVVNFEIDEDDVEDDKNKVNPAIIGLDIFEKILDEKRHLRKTGDYYSGVISYRMKDFVKKYEKYLNAAFHGIYNFDVDESIFNFIYSIQNEKVLLAIINNYKKKL